MTIFLNHETPKEVVTVRLALLSACVRLKQARVHACAKNNYRAIAYIYINIYILNKSSREELILSLFLF